MLYANVYCDNSQEFSRESINRFLDFWQNWPSLETNQYLLVFLFIQYSSNKQDKIARRFWNREKPNLNQAVEERLKELERESFSQFNNFSGLVLPKFEGITEQQATNWVDEVMMEYFPDDVYFLTDTKLEIKAIFEQWPSKDQPKRIPMDNLALKLRGILYQYTIQKNYSEGQLIPESNLNSNNPEVLNLPDNNRESVPLWQRITAVGFGTSFIAVLLVIAISIPSPTPFQIFVFRVTLSLAAGGVGAIIPGFINVTFKNWLRAGGALALFVLIYMVNPPELITETNQPTQQEQTETE